MSVIISCTSGWLVDHPLFIDQGYASVQNQRVCPQQQLSQLVDRRRSSLSLTNHQNNNQCRINVDAIDHENHDNFPNSKPVQRNLSEISNSKTQSEDRRHELFTEGCFESCRQFKYNRLLFDLFEPFLMDSQYKKLMSEMLPSTTLNPSLSCRGTTEADYSNKAFQTRRKRKRPIKRDENSSESHHSAVYHLLKDTLSQLTTAANELCYFTKRRITADNNRVARQTASQLLKSGEDFVRICSEQLSDEQHLCYRDSSCLFNRVIQHSCTTCCMWRLFNSCYLIPGGCRLLMSDISQVNLLLSDPLRYDLIVIDPPWENKSVKRKKTYGMVNNTDLKSLPVRQLAKSNALIAVWLTNSRRLLDFTRDELFRHWNVTGAVQWYWLKVLRTGEPIYELTNQMSSKRPYETLLLGKVNVTGDLDPLPQNRVMVSVPSSVHSSKPPLQDVLSHLLPESPSCLEMFARNLLPNWTSWGNEVMIIADVLHGPERFGNRSPINFLISCSATAHRFL